MKKHKPTTSGKRNSQSVNYRQKLSSNSSKPNKSLTRGINKTSGRNSKGRVTASHRGGGHKKKWRDVDFTYDKKDIPAKVESLEYDPNRSGFIAGLLYADGERRYILAPNSIETGDEILTSKKAEIKPGNRTQLSNLPVGTFVYNVEFKEGGGAKLARSAGNYAEITAKEKKHTTLKMPSTEIRKVSSGAWASIGEVSNDEHRLKNLGKAGRSRWLGRKPKVRGSAMNPVDHPYGGGEGRAGRGHRRARTAKGRPTGKGHKTRKPKKYSNKHIVKRRKVGKKKKKNK